MSAGAGAQTPRSGPRGQKSGPPQVGGCAAKAEVSTLCALGPDGSWPRRFGELLTDTVTGPMHWDAPWFQVQRGKGQENRWGRLVLF